MRPAIWPAAAPRSRCHRRTERERIRPVVAGLQPARAQGKRLGRPRTRPATIDVPGSTVRAAARAWGVSKSTAARRIGAAQLPTTPAG